MSMKNEIKSDKILVKDIFSAMWFRIPEYQRNYVWGSDEVHDLLSDISFALTEKPDSEYFLGSFVFQSKKANNQDGREYDENDLLDGQQRMTTLLILLAVIRDLSQDEDAKNDCQQSIFQKGSKYKNRPERTRIVFSIRDEVQDFLERYIKPDGGTVEFVNKADEFLKSKNESIKNIANAIQKMHTYFKEEEVLPEDFLQFLLNNVMLIYVSTVQLEDAFRLFTILNDRGIPLRNSDILKSINLGELENEREKQRYAKMWEEAEGELGDDFDRFLNHVRSILLKEKARTNLLEQYEDYIYKKGLLKKGKETFELIDRYLKHYNLLLSGNNYDRIGNFAFDNLIKVMLRGLPANDWLPPLLRFYDKFGDSRLFEFLQKLDAKFSSDWVGQYSPTYRYESMAKILKVIDELDNVEEVLNSDTFNIDKDSFRRVIEGDIYGRKFTRYILLKLDYYYNNHDQKMNFERLSVEHILPQNPKEDSSWCENFTDEDRNELTNKIGNLVLITRTKNSSQGRLDYAEKKKKYFFKNIDTCPNSLRVLKSYDSWMPEDLKKNHEEVLNLLYKKYGV